MEVLPVTTELAERLVLAAVFRLARDLRTVIDRELAEYGITTQQAALLLMATRHGGHGVRRLADPLGTDTAGLTRLVDRLEAKGLIAREPSPSDRRAVVLELTPAGRELLPELIAAFKRAHHRLLQGVDASQLDAFLATLHRLRQNLHEGAEVDS